MTSYHYFGNEGEAIPDDVSELVIHPLVQYIPKEACYFFEHLTRVNFNGSALQIIGTFAFNGCQALQEIEIPPSVTAIEDQAFEECRSLTNLRFHEDGLLTTIGMGAFAFCNSLTDISIPSRVVTIRSDVFTACECLTRVSFQEGLKVIENDAFSYSWLLEKVDFPRSLEMIGASAFACAALQEVNIEEGNLRVIGESAFYGCDNLHTIKIPSSIECVKSGAFGLCRSLEAVKFRGGLKHLEERAFYQCTNLQAVELPASLETICRFAFGFCEEFLSVGLGLNDRALTIHDEAFKGCISLVNICLPSDVGSVGFDSFRGCTLLEHQYGEVYVFFSLEYRFDNFPIHKKCYQASVTTADELACEIMSSKQSDDTGNPLVDSFGMTPFHVLLSGASCRIDLLQVLLDAYPPAILGWEDSEGSMAFEYLTQRSFLDEDSRTMLRMALGRWLVDPISSWRGLDVWKSDMSSRVNAIIAVDESEQRESLLDEASLILLRYEQIEATSLLELCVWKMGLESTNAPADDAAHTTGDKDDRGACRIRSGASVVIPNVIALL